MPIKVALVGAGSMGTNHLRVLNEFPEEEVQLVGVAELHEATLLRAVKRFHVAGYTDYREMIAKTRPDLISVVVPTHLHFEVASFALDAGVNVLVEKPIASTIEEALALIDLASVRGVRLAIGHIERFNPAIIELKKRLLSGSLGKIFYLHARRIGPFPPRIRDVGVILDLATHDVDVMRYLTNSEALHVVAECQKHIHETHEDIILGLIRFTNNVIGMLDVNWLTPTKVREISITGERGMYIVNYLSQDLYFYENDYTTTTWDALRSMAGVSEGTMTRIKVQKAEPLRLEYEHVLNALSNDTDLLVTGKDGLAVLHIVQQLTDATRTERMTWATKTT